MLQPARTKYRKMMKGRMRGKAYRGSELNETEVAASRSSRMICSKPITAPSSWRADGA